MQVLSRKTVLLLAALAAVGLSCSSSDSLLTSDEGGGNVDTTIGNTPPKDDNPPERINDANLVYVVEDDAAVFGWISPSDDSLSESVTAYEIRFSYTTGFFPNLFWERATPVPDPPVPTSPGTSQRYEFENPVEGRDLFVGIRSIDEEGNKSAPSSLWNVHIPGITFRGKCIDVITGLPIPGLAVNLTSGTFFPLTTNANGEFAQTNLSEGAAHVEVLTGNAGDVYHRFSFSIVISTDTTHTFYMIPYRQPQSPSFSHLSLLELLKFITLTDQAPYILAKWHNIPVPVFIEPFVNTDGVDYAAAARAAAQHWMDRTGRQMFAFVDAAPDTGITVLYKPKSEMGIQIAFTQHTVGADLHPIKEEILISDNISDPEFLYRVLLHEFGHTIRFEHVSDPSFIMYVALPLPADLNEDEVDLVKLHQSLPTRIDMRWYSDFVPIK